MRHSLAIALLMCLAVPDYSHSQITWQQTNGPYGGFVTGLAVDARGITFAATLDAGIFRSTDNGGNWTEVNVGLSNLEIRSLLVGPTGTFLAGVNYDPNGGIFRSTDGGQTWSRVFGSLPNTSVNTLAVDTSGSFTMDSTGVLFAGTDNGGAFRSTNDGTDWVPVNAGLPPVPILSIVANANGRILAGTQGGGAYFSTNHTSWVPSSLPRGQVNSLALDRLGQELAGTDSGIFRYDGISWLGTGLAGLSIRSLAVTGNTIFAGTDYDGIHRSTNNGLSWAQVNSDVVDASIIALAVDSVGFVLAGANGRGIFRSPDGVNWSRASNGLRNAIISSLGTDMQGNILASMPGEWIWRTTTGGADWQLLNSGFSFLDVAALLTTPSGAMFAGTSNDNGVYRSSDNGQTWAQINNGLTTLNVISLAVNSASEVFAGTLFGGIFRLDPAGTSWTQADNVAGRVTSLAISSGDIIFAGVDSGGVYRSTDNGTTWAFVNNGLDSVGGRFVLDVSISPTTGTVFAATFGGGLYRSTDGENWSRVDPGSGYNYVFSVSANSGGSIFFAPDDGTVFRSTDDGSNWISVSTGSGSQHVSSFVFDPNGYLYAGTFGGGVYRTAESTLPPATPMLLNPPTGAADQPTALTLQWNGSQIAASYHLQLGTDPSFASGLVVDNPSLADTFLTVTSLSNSTTYYWHVSATNSNGSSGFSGTYSFTTVVAPPAAPVLLSPADGATNQLASLRLSWSPSFNAVSYHVQLALDSLFNVILVDHPTLADTSGQIGPLANNTTYFWHVRAANPGGSSPYSPTWRFSTSASVSTGDTVTFPSEPTSTDYRLFSVPGVSSPAVNTIFTGSQGIDWRVLRDNGNPGTPSDYLVELTASSALITGEGYWVLKRGNLNVSRTLTMPSLASDGTYSIALDSGWNIIANPFNIDVLWASVLAANPIPPTSELISYQGTFNYTAATMEPFKGYYFFNQAASFISSLRIPFPFGSAVVPSAPPPITWGIELVFESGVNTDRENFLGIAPSARTDADALDARKAPLVFDQGFLYFSRPSWDPKYSRFRSDFRPALGEGQVWEFETSNPRKTRAQILFEGIEQIPEQYEVRLVSMQNSVPVDLRRSSVYAYRSVNETTPFKLIVGSSAFVHRELASLVPTTFELTQNFPNPFNPSTAITFKLPKDSRVRLDVVSVLGQHIATLADEAYRAAVHTVLWDGTNQRGARVASGVYFCRMIVDGSILQTRKMVLAK